MLKRKLASPVGVVLSASLCFTVIELIILEYRQIQSSTGLVGVFLTNLFFLGLISIAAYRFIKRTLPTVLMTCFFVGSCITSTAVELETSESESRKMATWREEFAKSNRRVCVTDLSQSGNNYPDELKISFCDCLVEKLMARLSDSDIKQLAAGKTESVKEKMKLMGSTGCLSILGR